MKTEHDYAYWKGKGLEAGDTTKTTERFCAGYIKKLKGRFFIHILYKIKKIKFKFYLIFKLYFLLYTNLRGTIN